jgi:hypothetical protein
MFALIQNGQVAQFPYSLADLQQANPNTSFPANDDAAYAEFGMLRVFNSTPPAYDENTQYLQQGTPVFDTEANRWAQVWQVVSLTAEEIQQRYDATAEAIRSERNAALAKSDWTQLADSSANKEAWAIYRQALRDVTAQSGFPWTITWPTQPDA